MIHRKASAMLLAILVNVASLAIAADPDIDILKSSGSLRPTVQENGRLQHIEYRKNTGLCGRCGMASAAAK